MMLKWMPWKFLLQRAAHHYGFMDPVTFLARMRKFAQPSEVQEPIELLRAGVSFHARGLLNTKAIQNNLDWVWPYWVQRQFNPADPSFMPRAFSFSHVNLTHRNWTAVGHPDLPLYPIVDPRGLVTPLFDGWSLDFWLIAADGRKLLPSQLENAEQQLKLSPNLELTTRLKAADLELEHRVQLTTDGGGPVLDVAVRGSGPDGSRLAIAFRPYNPEGVQFIEHLAYSSHGKRFQVNGSTGVELSESPDSLAFSNYESGDVIHYLEHQAGAPETHCPVGMATGAALYELSGHTTGERTVHLRIPLAEELSREGVQLVQTGPGWQERVADSSALQVPDKHIQFLYDAAVRTLILLSAREMVPGPYTYFRFWFRDACLMIHALLAIGLTERARDLLLQFPRKQKLSGYFQSQEGEWDSNGQVLWIFNRYEELTGESLGEEVRQAVRRAAAWIKRKRCRDTGERLHDGLLPPGFSAEHFGPNDYYYWDDFWAQAGLEAAAAMLSRAGDQNSAEQLREDAGSMQRAIARSLGQLPERRARGALPASPYRRMDSGAIGSLVADYPLQLFAADDPRIQRTVQFLLDHCFHGGGFFQDMIHSGINAYLTLDIAQTLLRQGDPRYRDLVRAVAAMASPTGQWPEAIHPATGGGCMGDGQHGWAAAEWIMMMRNIFLREEGGELVIGSGIFPEWLSGDAPVSFGPSPTVYGPVTVTLESEQGARLITVQGNWRQEPPRLRIAVPGFRQIDIAGSVEKLPLEPEEAD